MKMLNQLPKVKLSVSSKHAKKGKGGTTTVTVKNTGSHIAFFIRLKALRSKDKEEILPVLWEDNYFSLMPGEKRTLRATYQLQDLGKDKPVVEVEGWNL
jgi:exo-1,4-beta-D-glucosaminidase